jgi:hypothetical protein
VKITVRQSGEYKLISIKILSKTTTTKIFKAASAKKYLFLFLPLLSYGKCSLPLFFFKH